MTTFKTVEELRKMTTEEIKEYVESIEEESAEFAEWCGNELDTVLSEREKTRWYVVNNEYDTDLAAREAAKSMVGEQAGDTVHIKRGAMESEVLDSWLIPKAKQQYKTVDAYVRTETGDVASLKKLNPETAYNLTK
jgi:hypothetical protein